MHFRTQVRWIVGFAALWILAVVPGDSQTSQDASLRALQTSVQQSVELLSRSLVPIIGLGKAGPIVVGTGFFVSDDGVFVTALHVLRQGPGISIRALVPASNPNERMVAVELLLADAERDLALCRVVFGSVVVKTVPLTLAASSDAPPGTFVVLSGFPLGTGSVSSHFGIVSGRTAARDCLEVGVMVNDGESGAPVMRVDSGDVIGMASSVRTASTYVGAARGVEEQNSGLSLAARAEWISELMARYKSATVHR